MYPNSHLFFTRKYKILQLYQKDHSFFFTTIHKILKNCNQTAIHVFKTKYRNLHLKRNLLFCNEYRILKVVLNQPLVFPTRNITGYKNKDYRKHQSLQQLPQTSGFGANTQRWFNVDICWNNVVMSVNVISALIQRRFVNVDSSIKFNVETTLILGWL